MARALPPLGWFRSFEAAARNLNFTAAAEELGLTQSAVSQQVRALETRLGAQLFHRLPRGLALTDDGRRLLPQVENALGALGTATASFDTGPQAGLVTIATSVSIAQWVLAPHLGAFLADYPGLRVRVLSTIWSDEFKSAMADVEIRFGSEKQVGSGAMRMGPDPLIAVAAPGLGTDVREACLIEAVGTSDGWQSWARKAGLPDDLTPQIYVDSYGMALDLAVQGAGIALTSGLLAKPLVAEGKVVQVHPLELPATEGYYLAAQSSSEAATAFSEWIQALLTPAHPAIRPSTTAANNPLPDK